jgi:hypothetical protein
MIIQFSTETFLPKEKAQESWKFLNICHEKGNFFGFLKLRLYSETVEKVCGCEAQPTISVLNDIITLTNNNLIVNHLNKNKFSV